MRAANARRAGRIDDPGLAETDARAASARSAAELEDPVFDEGELRAALGRFATGVAFVTAEVDGAPHGMIVSSFAAVSLLPPLVSFCPARGSLTWRRMRTAGRFAVNVLGARHAAFARRAAAPGADRFAGAAFEPGRGGAPVLRDALAVLECELDAEHPAGDHWIVVGRVAALRVPPADPPLVYWSGAFGGFRSR
jgi:3-hydroxy-9,10-secoandrosta-1,3,5(10)-triene-9,17-dione monooxygenase reductase component